MGTFIGHLVPGLALASLGLWHVINTIHAIAYGSNTFILRFWYPLKTPLPYLEIILVFSFSIFAILAQIFDIQHLYFHFELDSIEHATIFLQLVIFASFAFLGEFSTNLPPNMLGGVSGILVSSIFGQELFLLHYHSTDHVGLEGHYHFLMQLIVCVSFSASLFATAYPSSFPAALVLSVSVVFQGCWFVNMGFALWVPHFVPRGCATQAMHGAVVCGAHEDEMRARALANLQFCWIWSSILVLIVSLCMGFGIGRQRRQSVEYEQLSSPTVGLKQIQL